jgi:hypothetical protein
VHNNYMTLPVLMIMVSNHYPMLFANRLNWLLLAGMGAAGMTIRHFFNLKNSGRSRPEVLVYGALLFLATAALSYAGRPKAQAAPAAGVTSFAEAQGIVATHCVDVPCGPPHPSGHSGGAERGDVRHRRRHPGPRRPDQAARRRHRLHAARQRDRHDPRRAPAPGRLDRRRSGR